MIYHDLLWHVVTVLHSPFSTTTRSPQAKKASQHRKQNWTEQTRAESHWMLSGDIFITHKKPPKKTRQPLSLAPAQTAAFEEQYSLMSVFLTSVTVIIYCPLFSQRTLILFLCLVQKLWTWRSTHSLYRSFACGRTLRIPDICEDASEHQVGVSWEGSEILIARRVQRSWEQDFRPVPDLHVPLFHCGAQHRHNRTLPGESSFLLLSAPRWLIFAESAWVSVASPQLSVPQWLIFAESPQKPALSPQLLVPGSTSLVPVGVSRDGLRQSGRSARVSVCQGLDWGWGLRQLFQLV